MEDQKLKLNSSKIVLEIMKDAKRLCKEFGLDTGVSILEIAKLIKDYDRIISETGGDYDCSNLRK